MKIFKKWWIWLIIILTILIISVIVIKKIQEKQMENSFENIGKSTVDFLKGIDNAKSHIDEFFYNSQTGNVEYKPSEITLEMFNRIKEGMIENEVILNLGQYDNKILGENSYVISYGNSDLSKGYWIQIVFNKNNKVISKSQIGLK